MAETNGVDDAERLLGRIVAVALPAASITGAIAVGLWSGVGPAVLVLASGALLVAIALLWTSIRTLSGDAPLPSDYDSVVARRYGGGDLEDRKTRVMRSLKDLESEHAIGKIDDADYETFVARYRQEAKSVLREMDREIAPARAKAERLARDHLDRQRLPKEAKASQPPASRKGCSACGASNEPDAAFCKQCGAAIATRTKDERAKA